MSDVYEHNPNDHEDPLAGPTWTVGLIGTALLVVTVLGLTAMFYDVIKREREDKVVERPVEVLEALHAEQEARLLAGPHQERRVELEDGDVALVIPIDQAIELYVKEAPVAR